MIGIVISVKIIEEIGNITIIRKTERNPWTINLVFNQQSNAEQIRTTG